MGWVAGKRQRVKRKEGYVWVEPGDPLPEAEHWPNRNSWERQGFIRKVHADGRPIGPVAIETRRTNALTKARHNAPPVSPEPRGALSLAVKAKNGGKGTKGKERPREGQEEAPMSEGLKGPGTCPGCGKDFLMLERHKCKEVG